MKLLPFRVIHCCIGRNDRYTKFIFTLVNTLYADLNVSESNLSKAGSSISERRTCLKPKKSTCL